MADFTITHRIEAPTLVDALNNLAAALSGGTVTPVAPVNRVNMTAPAPANVDVQVAPAPDANPTPAPDANPTPAAAIKPVTFDEIVTAGSQLLDAGRMADLLNLLKGFGVQAITQLKPEQYADVAVALRGLGAKI